MITERQRLARADGYGASEIAAAFGRHRFIRMADLQRIKWGVVEPDDAPVLTPDGTDDLAFLGNTFEASTAEAVEQCMGVKLVKPTGTYRHQNGLMFANLDRQIGKAIRGAPAVELKESGIDVGYGSAGSDILPEQEAFQMAAQIACSDAPEAHLARRGTGFERGLHIYHIAITDGWKQLIETIEEYIPKWHQRYVVNRDPLPDSEPPPSLDIISRIRREPKTTVVLPDELVLAWRQSEEHLKAAKEASEAAKARVLDSLGTAEGGTCSHGLVSYLEQNRKGFTVEPSTFRVCRFKPAK